MNEYGFEFNHRLTETTNGQTAKTIMFKRPPHAPRAIDNLELLIKVVNESDSDHAIIISESTAKELSWGIQGHTITGKYGIR